MSDSAETSRPPTDAELDAVIAQIQELDLQSDQRFAESLARRRARGDGIARIAYLLAQHQIDDSIILELVAQLRSTEFDRAYQVWEKRFGRLPDSLKEKSRQARFLSGRGFGSDLIAKILRGRVP